MDKEVKMKLFEQMLELENLAELYCDGHTYDGRNYFEQCNGASKMLVVLGLSSEYIQWSYGK